MPTYTWIRTYIMNTFGYILIAETSSHGSSGSPHLLIGIMVGLLSTLVILAWVAAFSVPRVYRDNQTQIDNAILPLKAKLDELQVRIVNIIFWPSKELELPQSERAFWTVQTYSKC